MSTTDNRPPSYKAIGISLAVASGLFIGTSFVLKKVGLLRANEKYNEEAGEGYGYLKNAYWWTGMTLMIIGEICNFVAYAFVDAILVTPLGALSVVITTILSAIFLKERLSFVGKAACFLCIIGSVVIVVNAPQQSSVSDIQQMQKFFLAPGFLAFGSVIIVGSFFTAFWVGPRYGKKSMLVYLTICSLIGGLSVVSIQGLGAAVTAQARGESQFNQPFLYVLFVFVICTLLTEIIYLNKALNLFNAALVTPTYYVYFTSATIVSSAVLFQGFHGTPIQILTIVMGFLVICTGVVLLQLAKSSKDVPDTAVFTGDLNDVRTIAEIEQPESEPKADALRGTAAIIRRISVSRQKMAEEEARRVAEDKLKDRTETLKPNEQVEWDGLRRRKTVRIDPTELQRRKSMHPPLGMAKFPDFDDEEMASQLPLSPAFLKSFQRRPSSARQHGSGTFTRPEIPIREVDETDRKGEEVEMNHVMGLPQGLRPPDADGKGKPLSWASDDASRSKMDPPTPRSGNKRQFSFQNMFQRAEGSSSILPWGHHRQPSKEHVHGRLDGVTEEERLGLVVGDSNHSDSDEEKGGRGRGTTKQPKSILKHTEHASQSDAAVHTVGQLDAYQPRYSLSSPDVRGPEIRTPGGGRPLPATPPAYSEAARTPQLPPGTTAVTAQGSGSRGGSPPRLIATPPQQSHGPGGSPPRLVTTPPRLDHSRGGSPPRLIATPPQPQQDRSRSGSRTPPRILVNDQVRQGSVDEGGQGPGGAAFI